MRINFKALVSFATVLGGIIASIAQHPDVVSTLPAKVGAGVVLIGSVVSAFTPAVHKPE